ncbi:uncharacterized protein [Typha angustifolia]|uniref:uncharacterized protein n=1 Tax=Typha angustifolia TaxID=59011 RepID=UPI003C2E5E03
MDQARLWMWQRRKLTHESPLLRSHISAIAAVGSTYHESWEEQAFAEDFAGHLGSCTWPPRSYSCSFCRREFRSAQALGGHMNVHRRDRARLKQSSSTNDDQNQDASDDHEHLNTPFTSVPTSHPPQVGSLVYSSKAMFNSPLSPSRAPVASAKVIGNEPGFASHSYFKPCIRENQKESLVSIISSVEDPRNNPLIATTELGLGRDDSNLREVSSRVEKDRDEYDYEVNSSKKRKIDLKSPLLTRSSSGNWQHLQTEEFKLCPIPVEELDLELRLGNPPKVKKNSSAS